MNMFEVVESQPKSPRVKNIEESVKNKILR